jgi:hypothetical protein
MWLITGFVTRLTRRVPLVEQQLLTLPEEHLRSSPDFSGVRVTRSSVLYVCFIERCLSFCTFSFAHCVVCSSSSSTDGFWFPLWYLQTLLININYSFIQSTQLKTGVNSGYYFIMWLITGFVTRLTRRVPLVEQQLPTLPEHTSSPPVLFNQSTILFLIRFWYCTSLVLL